MGRHAYTPERLRAGYPGTSRGAHTCTGRAFIRTFLRAYGTTTYCTTREITMPTLITARRLITDIGSVEFPVLIVDDDGTLTDISSDPAALAREEDTLTSAFFDVHTHGAMGHDVMSASPAELREVQRFLALRGVAQYLPTTVTTSIDATLRALESLASAIESEPQPLQAQPRGIHLEGPFLSHAKRGVHPEKYLQPPSIELFDRFHQAARGHIRLMTIAP